MKLVICSCRCLTALVMLVCIQFALSPDVYAAQDEDARLMVSPKGTIKDEKGRTRYIVDLIDEFEMPTQFDSPSKQIQWKRDKSAALIEAVSKLRGVELHSTTTLVGTSFTAYLDDKELARVRKDKRVKLVTEDRYLESSAIWTTSTDPSGQKRPWGLQAMAVSGAASNGYATVYVLDNGVSAHGDLPGLAQQLVSGPGISPTACYPHALHVAGIIGAADNGSGIVGVIPGVRIVSVAIGEAHSGYCPSIADTNSASTFVAGLEKIYEQIQIEQKLGIVNISSNVNGQVFAWNGTVGAKMKQIATPFASYWPYKGALIVQSAGNQFTNACDWAYNLPSANDGILVVGGLDENAQQVQELNGQGSFYSEIGGLKFADGSSNHGSCVEVWAPSQRIPSLWSGGGVQELSGTSMAAPHVAGFAALLLESNPSIATPAELEAAVRSRFVTLGGSGLEMPRMVTSTELARPTIEIAELTTAKRSLAHAVGFVPLFPSEINLRFGVVGAYSCRIVISRYGQTLYDYFVGSTASLEIGRALQWGQHVWTVTCTSPQGTQTTASATGYLKRKINLEWQAKTTSTNNDWQVIPNFAIVSWSISQNGTFDQFYYGENADSCQVQSYGFNGPEAGDSNVGANGQPDPANPYFNYYLPGYVQSNPPLWDSQPGFPNAYLFATFQFDDPVNSPYGFASWQGYKWKVSCTNWDGDREVRIMYGRPQP